MINSPREMNASVGPRLTARHQSTPPRTTGCHRDDHQAWYTLLLIKHTPLYCYKKPSPIHINKFVIRNSLHKITVRRRHQNTTIWPNKINMIRTAVIVIDQEFNIKLV